METYAADNEKMTSTPETLLEEIEAKNRELTAKKASPLLSFLKNKQEDERRKGRRKETVRNGKKKAKRRREEEVEREIKTERYRKAKEDRVLERDKLKDEPKIKLLKKPEKGDEKELDKKAQEIRQRESE